MTQDAWIDKSEIHKRIDLPGGGSISVKSADVPNSLRGPGLDGVIFDEAAFTSVDVWENILRPALSDKQGWAIFITTPNGRNWIHKRYVDAVNRPNWARWQCPTSENPLVTAEELADIKLEIGPRRFAQEHEARFTDVKGAMWPSSYFKDKIWADRWPGKFEMTAIALDPSMGKTEQSDYQAAVFIGLTSGTLWVDSMIVRLSPGELVDEVTEFWLTHASPNIGCETNGFQALYQNLFDDHCEKHSMMPMPFFGINNSENKTIRIQRLDPYLANSKLRFRDTPSNHLLVEQLMMFPLKDWHDDGPDALEMAIRLLTQGQPVIEYGDEMIEI